jgi:hypothetical protein
MAAGVCGPSAINTAIEGVGLSGSFILLDSSWRLVYGCVQKVIQL